MAKSKTISAAGGGGRSCSKSTKKKALDLDDLVPIPNSLSELEMNAIELLVQLSGGSSSIENSDFDSNNNGREGIHGKNRAAVAPPPPPPPPHPHDDEVSSRSEYKILSITDQRVEQDAEEEEDDEEILGRRKKKFRAISEVYQFTEPLIVNVVGVGVGVANNRKRKRKRTTTAAEEA